jgi:hypothetical protein
MKNKIVTALAGSLFGLGLASASVAQTTVSGNLDLAYHSVSSNATAGGSYRAVGRETQINIANKGKLSNGMDYAAGFSWELEGGEQLGVSTSANTDSANASNENVYIDFFYNKDSYVSVSNDHVPNTDVTFTNLVGWGYLGGQGIGNKTSIYPTSLNTSGYGIGISHNFGPMRLSGTFVPNPDKDGATVNDTGHTLTSAADTNGNSKLELIARGDLGVKGLDLMLGVSRQDRPTTGATIDATAQDPHGRRASIKYNAGDITVAADYIKVEGQNITTGATPTATTSADHELTGKSYGIAYAINKDISIGYTRSMAETSKAGYAEEKVNHFAIGYNLGAVTAQIQYRDAEGVAGTAGADGEGEILAVKLSTRF